MWKRIGREIIYGFLFDGLNCFYLPRTFLDSAAVSFKTTFEHFSPIWFFFSHLHSFFINRVHTSLRKQSNILLDGASQFMKREGTKESPCCSSQTQDELVCECADKRRENIFKDVGRFVHLCTWHIQIIMWIEVFIQHTRCTRDSRTSGVYSPLYFFETLSETLMSICPFSEWTICIEICKLVWFKEHIKHK